MRRIVLIPSILFSCTVFASTDAKAQEINLGATVAASPSGSGVPRWYEIHIDPDDSKNMIICGTNWNAEDNANYGFVYYSADGGQNWAQTLEDKNSRFVTEQSCAYGAHGVAYFVSDASKLIDDLPHHDQGTTRIYVSRDAGKTWRVGIKTGWTDWSISVVDTMPGPNQNRLYVFFNGLTAFYSSVGQNQAADAEIEEIKKGNAGTRVGMISYKDGDTEIKGPLSNTEMAGEKNRGSYPSPAFLLKNGSILTFYFTKHKITEGDKVTTRFTAEALRTSADRSSLENPVRIEEFSDDPRINSYDQNCNYFLNSAGTYDAVRDKLYFLYPSIRDKTCHLFLTTSVDDGKSWSKVQAILSPDESPTDTYGHPAISVNREGVLGVMWEKKSRSGCWMFAVSEDGGVSLSRAKQLGACDGDSKESIAPSTANLWTVIFQADSFLNQGLKDGTARIIVRNTQNAVGRNANAIAVTPDGAFQSVWSDAERDDGELRISEIHVTSAAELITSETKDLVDVTQRVAVLYGGSQRYDARSGILTVDVVIQNKSAERIDGPFKLAVPSLTKDYGLADIANAENKASGAGAIWDITSAVAKGGLDAGATSKPFSLKFRYLPSRSDEAYTTTEDFLDLNIKIFAGSKENGRHTAEDINPIGPQTR
jgi:hypothetical protein